MPEDERVTLKIDSSPTPAPVQLTPKNEFYKGLLIAFAVCVPAEILAAWVIINWLRG